MITLAICTLNFIHPGIFLRSPWIPLVEKPERVETTGLLSKDPL
jgi:hypothetical protein